MCEEAKTKINKLIEYSVKKDCFLLGLEKAETPRHAYDHIALAWSKSSEDMDIHACNVINQDWYKYYAESIADLFTWACPNIKIAKDLYNGNITENERTC